MGGGASTVVGRLAAIATSTPSFHGRVTATTAWTPPRAPMAPALCRSTRTWLGSVPGPRDRAAPRRRGARAISSLTPRRLISNRSGVHGHVAHHHTTLVVTHAEMGHLTDRTRTGSAAQNVDWSGGVAFAACPGTMVEAPLCTLSLPALTPWPW